MADSRKYYYLKLKENYFDDDAVVLLESMPGGEVYSNMLLKLYLKSLKNGGRLQLAEGNPYNIQMLATITRQREMTVRNALAVFVKLGLIEPLVDGTLYMSNIELFIGKSSTEAERKRKARMDMRATRLLPEPDICRPRSVDIFPPYNADACPPICPDVCPPDAGKADKEKPQKPLEARNSGSGPVSDICPPEIEKKIEKETEREKRPPAPALGRFENVFLSDRELTLLKRELPQKWQYYVERLSSHMASTGKQYQSHLATILKWAQEDGGKRELPTYAYQEGESL